MDWNPHAPDVLGLEWIPASGPTPGGYRIDAPIRAAAMRVDSTVTQTVSTLGVVVNADTAGGRVMAEVYPAGDVEIDPASVVTEVYNPNDQAGPSDGSGWIEGFGGPSDKNWEDVSQDPIDVTVYVYGNNQEPLGGSAAGEGGIYFDTVTLTGRRILDVRLLVWGATNSGPHLPSENLRVGQTVGGLTLNDPGSAVWKVFADPDAAFPAMFADGDPADNPVPSVTVFSTGEVNPRTGQPWTVAEIAALSGPDGLTIQVESGSNVTTPVIYKIQLEVDHCPETRLSRDVITAGATGERWLTTTPHKPNAAANMAKVSGTDLLLVVRQPRYGNCPPSTIPSDYLFTVPYLLGVNDTPPPGLAEYRRIALNADGTIGELGDPSGNRTIGFDMKVAGTQSVDAQPFAHVDVVSPPASGSVQQEISQASAQAYAGTRIPLRYDVVPTGNLVVVLRRRSDNVAMGTATITPALAASFPADPVYGWRTVIAPFAASATLAAGVQYYFDVQRSGGASGDWKIPRLTGTVGATSADGVGSYRGTSDVASFGGGDLSNADYPIIAYASIDTPADVTATAGSAANLNAPADCGITRIGFVTIAWTATADPLFDHYEIQRDDPYTGWQTFAAITDQDVESFIDAHGRQNVESSYRIRVVSVIDGFVSAWSAEHTATRESFGCGYTFTANSLLEASVAYGDVYDSPGPVNRQWTFPEVDEVVDRIIHGRDGKVSFIPAERRFSEFDRQLLVSSRIFPVAGPAEAFADALRDLSRATLPFVCVTDEDGGRWFANVKVRDARDRRPSRFDYVNVHISENTRTEFPVDTAVL